MEDQEIVVRLSWSKGGKWGVLFFLDYLAERIEKDKPINNLTMDHRMTWAGSAEVINGQKSH